MELLASQRTLDKLFHQKRVLQREMALVEPQLLGKNPLFLTLYVIKQFQKPSRLKSGRSDQEDDSTTGTSPILPDEVKR